MTRRSGPPEFVARVERETAERVARGISSPWLAPIGAAPPEERPAEPLSARDAAICLVQLCDVLARAHAGGWAGLSVDVYDVSVVRTDSGWRAAVVLPHPAPRGKFPRRAGWPGEPRVRADLRTAATFFVDLVTGVTPNPGRWSPPSAVPDAVDPDLRAALAAVLTGEDDPVADAAGLAALVLPLAPELAAVVAAMPRVPEVRVRHDWTRLVTLGEAELAQVPGDRFTKLPLAAAYHQRAATARAAGDLASALSDLDRAVALDPGPRHLTTRALVRRESGRGDAQEDLEAAIAGVRQVVDPDGLWVEWVWRGPGWGAVRVADGEGWRIGPAWDATHPPYDDGDWRVLPGEERAHVARALYVRAVWRFAEADVAGAAADLALATPLLPRHPTDVGRAVAQALVPVRRAQARVDPSAEARWELVRALVAAGRREDALREAEVILAGPDAERYRRRIRRLADTEPADHHTIGTP